MAVDIRNLKLTPKQSLFIHSKARYLGLFGSIGCLPCDAEYLARDGWHKISEYNGEEIAEWDCKTGKIRFVKPIYTVFDNREFIRFYDKYSLDMVVSEEHRVPLYDYKGKFIVKRAYELERNPSRYTVPINFIVENDGLGWDENEIRLAVAFNADGTWTGYENRFVIRKERKKKRLRELFDKLGIKYIEKTYKGRPTETVFRFKWWYNYKNFGSLWWEANSKELEIIIDEVRYWDGIGHSGYGETRFYTTNKKDADFIQYAAHATGRRATIRPKWDNVNNHKINYTVFIAEHKGKNKVCLRGDSIKIERVKAVDGKKYTFTVPSTFFVARYHDRVFITGNSGKTVVGCLKGIDYCLKYPGIVGAVVRRTNPELESSTKKIFLDLLHQVDGTMPKNKKVILAENNQKNWVKFTNGSMVFFFHTDDEGLFKGPEFGWVLVDQAEEIPENIAQRITERLRQVGYPQQAMFIGNTDRGHNWCYHWFKKKEKPFSELIEVTILDNAENLDKGYLLDQFSRPEEEKKIWLYGSWDNPKGLVLRLTDINFIQPFNPPDGWAHYIGVDPAGSTGYCAALHAVVDYEGNIYIVNEYYQKNKLVKYHAEGILRLTDRYKIIYMDPSAWRKQEMDKDGKPQFITLADRYREYGVYGVPAENSISIGIDMLREYAAVDPNRRHPFTGELGAPRLYFVKEKLPNLMEQLAEWMIEDPSKEPCHCLDALKYIVATRPPIPVRRKYVEENQNALAFMEM